MRTTLNLDEDVAARLSDLASERGESLSRSANDLIRAGFVVHSRGEKLPPYDPPVFDSGRPLRDVTNVGEVLDYLDREGDQDE